MKNDTDWCIFTDILEWTCTNQWRCSYLLKHELTKEILDNLKKFFSIKAIQIVLDSMLYETLKWPQIAPFCISSKKIPDPPSLKNDGVYTIKPQLRPWNDMHILISVKWHTYTYFCEMTYIYLFPSNDTYIIVPSNDIHIHISVKWHTYT